MADPWDSVPVVRERSDPTLDTVIDVTNLSQQERLNLRPGQRVRINGQETRLTGNPEQDGSGTPVAEGLNVRQAPWESVPVVPEPTESQSLAQQEAMRRIPETDAAAREGQLLQGFGLGFADEAAGRLAGLGQMAGNAVRTATGQPIELNSADLSQAVTQRIRDQNSQFQQEHPWQSAGLQIAGGGLTGGVGAGRSAVARAGAEVLAAGGTQAAARAAARQVAGRYAVGGGAAYGTAYGGGSAEGSFAERLPSAAAGGLFGGFTGGAIQGIGNGVRSLADRIGGIAVGSSGAARAPNAVAARIADFDQVGIDPNLSNVGGTVSRRLAQTLSGNVFTGGPVARAAQTTRDQTINAVDNVASQYGGAAGREGAGRQLIRGAESGAQRYRQEGGRLYEPVNALEANTTPIPLANSRQAIDESLSVFQTPELRDWFTRNATDLTQFQNVLSQSGNQATFAEARQLRSIVGNMLNDPQVFNSRSQAGLRRLYGALSDDIRQGAQELGGDAAANALGRADQYYSAARTRADEVLKQFYGADTESQAYDRLINLAKTTGARSSWSELRQLRDSLTPEEWNDIGAGVIRSLGNEGDNFSVSTFATQWDRMTPQARRVLFGGVGREQQFSDLQALARVAKEQQQAGRFYNYSESGNVAGNIGSAAALGGAVVSAASGNAMPLIGIVSSLGVGNGMARLLTSPGVARWLSRPARQAIPQAQRLAQTNPDFARFWAANRNAIINAVNANDNALTAPLQAAAEEDQP